MVSNFNGYGNSCWPLYLDSLEYRCCEECNKNTIIPTRRRIIFRRALEQTESDSFVSTPYTRSYDDGGYQDYDKMTDLLMDKGYGNIKEALLEMRDYFKLRGPVIQISEIDEYIKTHFKDSEETIK